MNREFTPVEGSEVVYVGDDSIIGLGSRAQVLANAGNASHVRFSEGQAQGQVTMVANLDIVPVGRYNSVESDLHDSITDGTLMALSVREVYATVGEKGLLASLREDGYLDFCANLSQTTRLQVIQALRRDPAIAKVLDQLSIESGNSMLQSLSSLVLRNATKAR